MSCRLLQDIRHTCEYNAGGIKDIYLLDVNDFLGYKFRGDRLYNECMVESIRIAVPNYIRLDTVDESNYTETMENGFFKQEITTFVRSIDFSKTSNLLLANRNKYIVIFRMLQGKTYTFGSEDGATVGFSQQSGQSGEVSGYNITIVKDSLFPLFEIDIDNTQHITRVFNDRFNNKFN